MIEHHRHSHPLLLSGPWNLTIAHKAKKAIEDEDARLCIQIYLLQKLKLFRVLSDLLRGHKE
jgi:hypothetical protein